MGCFSDVLKPKMCVAKQQLKQGSSYLQFQARIVAVEVAMKWCNNVHFYSGVIITGIRRHTDKRDDIIISDGGRFDDLLSSLQYVHSSVVHSI